MSRVSILSHLEQGETMSNRHAYEGDRVEPLLINASQFAGLLQVSSRTLWRMLSAGRLPKPIRVGGIVRWRVCEVKGWVAEGCPERSGMQSRS